jgi:hypothetical protein
MRHGALLGEYDPTSTIVKWTIAVDGLKKWSLLRKKGVLDEGEAFLG